MYPPTSQVNFSLFLWELRASEEFGEIGSRLLQAQNVSCSNPSWRRSVPSHLQVNQTSMHENLLVGKEPDGYAFHFRTHLLIGLSTNSKNWAINRNSTMNPILCRNLVSTKLILVNKISIWMQRLVHREKQSGHYFYKRSSEPRQTYQNDALVRM